MYALGQINTPSELYDRIQYLFPNIPGSSHHFTNLVVKRLRTLFYALSVDSG